ncbi:MAG: response regulator [Rhodobacteraceae bacterium]|nr:response regulator [Paracoccaceae bacterium]
MSKHVLIVEDEPNIVESLSFLLERAGFEVSSEPDGAMAMDRIGALKPDLIILDVMLPNRSGFDILRDLGELAEAPHVLMLTAKGQARDRQTAEAIGVTRFMTKPFANAEIIKAVQEMLA